MTEQQLQEVFRAIRGGDGEAFARMYHDIKQPVYVIALRITGNVQQAEDITQEVFLRLYQSPPDPSVRSLRAWIFRMTHNLALDTLRRCHTVDLDAMPEEGEDTTAALAQRLDLEAAMRTLSLREREIVTMHVNAALTFPQIARIVGQSPSAVWRCYHRAIDKLRAYMNGGTS